MITKVGMEVKGYNFTEQNIKYNTKKNKYKKCMYKFAKNGTNIIKTKFTIGKYNAKRFFTKKWGRFKKNNTKRHAYYNKFYNNAFKKELFFCREKESEKETEEKEIERKREEKKITDIKREANIRAREIERKEIANIRAKEKEMAIHEEVRKKARVRATAKATEKNNILSQSIKNILQPMANTNMDDYNYTDKLYALDFTTLPNDKNAIDFDMIKNLFMEVTKIEEIPNIYILRILHQIHHDKKKLDEEMLRYDETTEKMLTAAQEIKIVPYDNCSCYFYNVIYHYHGVFMLTSDYEKLVKHYSKNSNCNNIILKFLKKNKNKIIDIDTIDEQMSAIKKEENARTNK